MKKKTRLWLILLLILFLVNSCASSPTVVENVEETLSPMPQRPKGLILTPTTKEDYRYNYNLVIGYAKELENWIYTEHPELKKATP